MLSFIYTPTSKCSRCKSDFNGNALQFNGVSAARSSIEHLLVWAGQREVPAVFHFWWLLMCFDIVFKDQIVSGFHMKLWRSDVELLLFKVTLSWFYFVLGLRASEVLYFLSLKNMLFCNLRDFVILIFFVSRNNF